MTQPLPAALFNKNRAKLQNKLTKKSLAIFFSNHKMPKNGDVFYPYRQNSDLIYLTGINQPETILILGPDIEILFIKKPDEMHMLWEGDLLDKEQATNISGIEKICWEDQFISVIDKALKEKKHIYFNTGQKLNQSEIETKDEIFLSRFRQEYPFHSTRSVRPLMEELRLHKEHEETDQIRKGIEVTHKAFDSILQALKPGVNEKTLEAILRYEFLMQGSEGPAYDPIIASGKNACVLHYTKNNSACPDGGLLLMDIGAEINNYASDISRTVPVNGKFTKRQKECYQAVLDVMEKTINIIRPGIRLAELNKKTKEWLIEKHLELGLYKKSELEQEDLAKKYFPHGVSHFIGLDVHDCGNKNTILKEGMVISCEPGLYIPEENIGIRIEDDILVGEPSVNLSEKIPKNADEIERLTGSKKHANKN